MRRLLTPLLLIALVLCAQQGALVHALAHGVGQTTMLTDGGHAAPASGSSSGHCEKCFAFAHVAGAISAATPTLLAQADDFAPPPHHALAAAPAPRLTTHSRDPPAIL